MNSSTPHPIPLPPRGRGEGEGEKEEGRRNKNQPPESFPQQVNCLQLHKRTFHTLRASKTFREGKPYMVFGTSGADGQFQTHVQVMTSVFDFGMDIQSAIEAPRWLSGRYLVNQPEGSLNLEGRISPEVMEELRRRGHQVNVVENWSQIMGCAHEIIIHPENGLRLEGSDLRADGAAIGY